MKRKEISSEELDVVLDIYFYKKVEIPSDQIDGVLEKHFDMYPEQDYDMDEDPEYIKED